MAHASSSSSAASTSAGHQQQFKDAHQELKEFWPNVTQEVAALTNNDLRVQELPLARIKKIMKLDEDVKMISAEAPVLFAKAAEIFIHELTLRAWVHTEDNKRRTLQRNDIAMAISKYDQFDFLIDIVPRDELKPSKKDDQKAANILGPEQVQYYLQLAAQQHNLQLQQAGASGMQVVQQALPGGLQYQVLQSGAGQVLQQPIVNSQQQTVLLGGQQFQTAAASQPQQGLQLVQQVLGPNGEIQNVPIQLTANQLQMLRMQLSGTQGNQQQSIILQTGSSPMQTTMIQSSPGQSSNTQIIQS